MGIPVDRTANSGFKISANQKRRATLESALDSFLKEDSNHVRTILIEGKMFRLQLAEYRSPTIGDASSINFAYTA